MSDALGSALRIGYRAPNQTSCVVIQISYLTGFTDLSGESVISMPLRGNRPFFWCVFRFCAGGFQTKCIVDRLRNVAIPVGI